jgi:hypothetical protein
VKANEPNIYSRIVILSVAKNLSSGCEIILSLSQNQEASMCDFGFGQPVLVF